MKILYQVNIQTGLGTDRWIGNGFKDAFEVMAAGMPLNSIIYYERCRGA